jgi:peptidoglycan lytic transglycosylase B
MTIKNTLVSLFLAFISLASFNILAELKNTAAVDAFIKKMAKEHHFDKIELAKLLDSAEIKANILKAISSPAESMPWYKYRKIFMTDTRITNGVKFWQENAPALTAVEQQYGVPAEIIVAIIGVETLYGTRTGNHRVIDALSTLGFAYPKRSKFFLSELENFLLLCREEQITPLEPTGSYAGAMGMPQFMPSSYRAYAVDFNGDNHRDIWNNNADTIASVANYFARHHWQTEQAVAFPVNVTGEDYKQALSKDLKPDTTIAKLKSFNITVPEGLDDSLSVKLFAFENEKSDEYWIGLQNFYVITRYNHSPLYAMAVFQLSQAILDNKAKTIAEK